MTIANTLKGIQPAIDEIFAPHGGVERVIPKNGGTVYVKPNGIHFTPPTRTPTPPCSKRSWPTCATTVTSAWQ